MWVTTINVFRGSNSVGDFLWSICFLFCEDWITNFSLRKESHQFFSNCKERDDLEEPTSYTAYTLSFLWHLVQFQKVFRLLLNSVPSHILICKDLQLFQWENLRGKILLKWNDQYLLWVNWFMSEATCSTHSRTQSGFINIRGYLGAYSAFPRILCNFYCRSYHNMGQGITDTKEKVFSVKCFTCNQQSTWVKLQNSSDVPGAQLCSSRYHLKAAQKNSLVSLGHGIALLPGCGGISSTH